MALRLFIGFKLLLLCNISIAAINATQIMHRPDNYKDAPRIFKSEQAPSPTILTKRAPGKVQIGYFTNWGTYGPNFQPTDIDTNTLTHILYAFADINNNGTVALTDPYADEQRQYPGDDSSEPGSNLYGALKQLYLLKLKNRSLKVLISIGGGTSSAEGHFAFITDPAKRNTFVNSAVQFIEDYGLDGVDLDYEYATAADGQDFADLLTALRIGLDAHAKTKGDAEKYQLSVAVSAGWYNYVNLIIPQMDKALDYWNLMGYDYAGPWTNWTDNQANVYGGERTNLSSDAAIKYFTAHGATSTKITLGIPLYGRAFEETDGLAKPYNGVGPGSISAGVYSYNTLPLAGAKLFENTTDITSYSYDSSKKEFVTYDTPEIVSMKAKYVTKGDLGGSMFWELSTDKVGDDSLVKTAAGVYGSLDQTQASNHINYPDSKWDNVKSNMDAAAKFKSSSSVSSKPLAPSARL